MRKTKAPFEVKEVTVTIWGGKKKLNKALAEGWEQVGVRGAIHTLRRPNTK